MSRRNSRLGRKPTFERLAQWDISPQPVPGTSNLSHTENEIRVPGINGTRGYPILVMPVGGDHQTRLRPGRPSLAGKQWNDRIQRGVRAMRSLEQKWRLSVN